MPKASLFLVIFLLIGMNSGDELALTTSTQQRR